MGLLDRWTRKQEVERLKQELAHVKARAQYPAWSLAQAEAQRFNLPNLDKATAQADLYRKLSWINAGIKHVAHLCAVQQFNVLKQVGDRTNDIEGHEFEERLQRPNPLMSRFELIASTVMWRKLTGNAYWWLSRRSEDAPVDEIWLLPSNTLTPVPDGRLYLKGYLFDPGDGQKIPLEPWEVVQFRGFHPSNPWVGASDIEALAAVAEGDYKAQRYNTNVFSEDNAKFPGILTFSQYIPDDEWEEMHREFSGKNGGTQRALRMMRGVGQGDVSFTQTNMTPSDMEFIAGRTFTREEIWAVMAPGLASILAVNATEANALAGRKTLMELAVWPELVAMAETLTNKVLPAYGDDLRGEFDDCRMTDRAMEQAEISTYSATHTVDEIRAKYYGDDPIGDERGTLFPVQVGAAAAQAQEQQGPTEDAPVPSDDGPTETEDDDEEEEAAKAELATWRKYALKHGATKASAFKPDHLPRDVAAVIAARLAAATDEGEVKAAFRGPFLVKASRITGEGLNDPLGDAKDAAEERLRRLLKSRLNGQFERVMALLGEPPDLNNLDDAFWADEAGLLLADVRPELEAMAREAGERLGATVGLDWTLTAEEAGDWAGRYGYELIRGLDDTTRRILQKRVAQYIQEPGRTIGDLKRDLAPYFGAQRADAIAVTEVTRAYAEGEALAAQEAQAAGLNMVAVWHTNRDELVCNLCGGLNGQVVTERPPKHPRCRCWIGYEWRPSA